LSLTKGLHAEPGQDLVAAGISIRAARNEYEPAQIAVRASKDLSNVRVECVVGVGVIQTASWGEAATRVQFAATPAGATTVTFTSLGAVATANADASALLTEIAATHSGTVTDTRPLTVLVGGGRTGIKICDPAITDATSPRFCTAA